MNVKPRSPRKGNRPSANKVWRIIRSTPLVIVRRPSSDPVVDRDVERKRRQRQNNPELKAKQTVYYKKYIATPQYKNSRAAPEYKALQKGYHATPE